MKIMIVLAAAVGLSVAPDVIVKLGVAAPPTASVLAPSTKTVPIGSSVPSVTEGGTIQFTAKEAVTWSLAPGSAGSIDPNTGVYTAPAAITVKNASGGCQNSPNDSIFNTRIDKAPVHANSAAWVAMLKKSGINYEQAWGLSRYDNSTLRIKLTTKYTPQYNGVYPVPVWPELREEGGNFAVGFGGAGGDHHITEVNLSNCQYADIYNYAPGPNDTGTATSAVRYSGLSNTLPSGGTDAAGMYLQPLTLRLAELENGEINHALRFSMSNNYIVPSFVWPATANAYPYSKNGMPYGTRLRLKSSAVNLSNYSPMAQILLAQLMQYGLILTDGGGYVSISVDQDVHEDPTAASALNEATKAVNSVGGMGAFEVIDESELQADARSAEVKINHGTVTPDDYAQVIATPKSGRKAMTSRVALQGVGIGVPDPSITVAAGATVPFIAWTSGTTKNDRVAWKTDPSLGKMTSSGSFTAPAVVKPASTKVIAYSVENPSATQTVAVHILPVATDGSIRVSDNMGPAYKYAYPGSIYGPDSHSIMWWPEPGFIAGGYTYCDWGGAGGGIFNGWCTFAGNDVTHNFLLPNGNYRVDLYVGVPHMPGTRPGSWNVGAQRQWTHIAFNPVTASNGGTQPVTLSLPAQVTDNKLSFTISNKIVNTDKSLGPILSGFAIVPDSSRPHITISDANGNSTQSNIMSNSKMQFSAVGWMMPHTVTWSILPQIGTISSTGLYTAPSMPQTATLTVTAKSTTDPTKTASMKILLSRGSLNVSATGKRLPRSMTEQFRVDLNGRDYSNVTWSATVGSINPKTGLYTAPETLTADTIVTIRATSNDDHLLVGSHQLNVLKNIDPIRINCGDWWRAEKDANGNSWSSDWGADGGTTYHGSPFIMTGSELDGQPLTAKSPMFPVYDSSHLSTYTPNNQFNYKFTLPNGSYEVTLLFGNWGFEAHRALFNVSANGHVVISKYDPDSDGLHVASTKTFTVDVTKKSLTLKFAGIGSKIAEVNGIQIVAQ
jgi:hypothetical protein